MPSSGNFCSRYAGLRARKIQQYSTQKFLFYQTEIKLISEFYRKLDMLNAYSESSIVWPKKNTEIALKKNMQQLPKPRCAVLSSVQQVVIPDNLDPVNT